MNARQHRPGVLKVAAAVALATLTMQSACGTAHQDPTVPLGEPLPAPPPITAVTPITTPIATPPIGGLESAFSAAPGFATATGWVAGLAPGAALELELSIDDSPITRIQATAPAIAGELEPADIRVGFGLDSPAPAGEHDICMAILDRSSDSAIPIGCERITIDAPAADDRSIELTAVTPHADAATVDVRGVVQAGSAEAPAEVSLAVAPDAGAGFTASAAVERGTFRIQLGGLGDGIHTICPLDPDGSFDTICGSVVVGDLTVGVAGSPTSVTAVEPPAWNPLNPTRRDAGISVRLSDGSVMWFFGDTSERSPAGVVRYFINNTATWATADDPAVTLDAVGPADEPFEFITPALDFCDASEYGKPVYWPEAAVAIPQPDGTDRVFLFVSEVCVGAGYFSFEGVGMALVEVSYDPTDRPAGRRIVGQVVNDDIGTIDEPYGRAAVLADDDNVYVYQCGSLVDPHERCTVARTPAQSVADTSTWRYWNGGDWTLPDSWANDPAAAATMELPPGTEVPIAAFTVTYDETVGAYVFGHSPYPVYSDRIAVRVAATPVGPWTPAVEITFPNCIETVDGEPKACYAATIQPAFSRPGQLGLGYFDQYVADSAGGAEYYACSAQVAVDSPHAPNG